MFTLILFYITGFLWTTGPAGAERVFESVWWAHGHPATGGATGAAGNCPQAAQTLEGQRSPWFTTLTNYCTPLEAHKHYFINLTRKTFGFNRVPPVWFQLTWLDKNATLSVFICSHSRELLISDRYNVTLKGSFQVCYVLSHLHLFYRTCRARYHLTYSVSRWMWSEAELLWSCKTAEQSCTEKCKPCLAPAPASEWSKSTEWVSDLVENWNR